MIDQGYIEDLLRRATLSEIVGRRHALRPAGKERKACCPFHDEKTPSFYVNDDKGFWHCFGCQAHGNAFGFVMRFDGVTFPEAVARVARESGVAPPERGDSDVWERRRRLEGVLERAAQVYQQALHTPAGAQALAYWRERGLSDESAVRFRVGYAAGDGATLRALRETLMREGYGDDELVASGLFQRYEETGAVIPFLRNRLIFPIFDRTGSVIAFGGRVLPGAHPDAPKYLNTRDTLIFHKKQTLYNASQALPEARRGVEPLIVEGYLDVIALAQAGYPAAMAPLGTALTLDQVDLVWRSHPSPILAFDGDPAGRKAARRTIALMAPHLATGRSAKVSLLTRGDDPADLVFRHGARAATAIREAALPLPDALWTIDTNPLPAAQNEIGDLRKRLYEVAKTIRDIDERTAWYNTFKARMVRLTQRPGDGLPDAVLMAARCQANRTLERRPFLVLIAAVLRHPEVLRERLGDFLDPLEAALVAAAADAAVARTLRAVVEDVFLGAVEAAGGEPLHLEMTGRLNRIKRDPITLAVLQEAGAEENLLMADWLAPDTPDEEVTDGFQHLLGYFQSNGG